MKKLLIIALLLIPGFAGASEVTGTLSTGVQTGVEGTVITAPSASPVAGTYTSAQSVTLSASGASNIHYTTDGTTPACSTGSTYSSAISVGSSLTIKALSCYPNSAASPVSSFAYTINITVPPSGGGGGGFVQTISTVSTLSAAAEKVDSNHDGKIDVLDFVALMANWGKSGFSNIADFNGDGRVDILDFIALMVNWTK